MTNTQSAFVTQPLFKTKSLAELGGSSPVPTSGSSSLNYSKPFASTSIAPSTFTTGAGKQTKFQDPSGSNSGFSMPSAADMQGYAGLASSFAQLASLPGQLKLAKLQRKGLQENLRQTKLDNAQRATVRSNLANYRTGG